MKRVLMGTEKQRPIQKPDIVVCINPNAMVFGAMIAQYHNVKHIIYEDQFFDKERLPKLYYIVDRMIGDKRKVLVVDDVCGTGRKLAVATGPTTQTFAFCTIEGSKFVPNYRCLKAPPGIEVVFPWETIVGEIDGNKREQGRTNEGSHNQNVRYPPRAGNSNEQYSGGTQRFQR
jgi:hypothetical protein